MRAEKRPSTRTTYLKQKNYWTGGSFYRLYPGQLTTCSREPAVIEVFSRGLHPQHWHVASRVAEDEKGEAYLEVSRKEATLSDVDNILRGLYKTHL